METACRGSPNHGTLRLMTIKKKKNKLMMMMCMCACMHACVRTSVLTFTNRPMGVRVNYGDSSIMYLTGIIPQQMIKNRLVALLLSCQPHRLM